MDKELRAKDAQRILDDPVFRDAMQALRDRIESRALQVKTTDTDETRDIIRCKQLLVGIERELRRFVADGKVQSITDEKVRLFRQSL